MVVGSHRWTSWVEIVAEFVFHFGFFPGFKNQSMTLKMLVQRFKRAAMQLFQSHQLSINALRSTHLLSFGFCHVASLHISRSFQFPDHIFAFLMGCASKFAAKNNPLNFVPHLHEFIWLSDACIQIKWLSPTLSSPVSEIGGGCVVGEERSFTSVQMFHTHTPSRRRVDN